MEKNEVLEELKNIYSDVSEWLKFAEAKHAGMFAVWIALIVAVISNDNIFSKNIVLQTIIVVASSPGLIINIISFVPFLNQQKSIKERCYKKYQACDKNAVFYTSIFVKTYDEQGSRSNIISSYKQILKERGFEHLDDPLIEDYICQIVDVSTVGSIKVYLFNVAVHYILALIGIAAVCMIVA